MSQLVKETTYFWTLNYVLSASLGLSLCNFLSFSDVLDFPEAALAVFWRYGLR